MNELMHKPSAQELQEARELLEALDAKVRAEFEQAMPEVADCNWSISLHGRFPKLCRAIRRAGDLRAWLRVVNTRGEVRTPWRKARERALAA